MFRETATGAREATFTRRVARTKNGKGTLSPVKVNGASDCAAAVAANECEDSEGVGVSGSPGEGGCSGLQPVEVLNLAGETLIVLQRSRQLVEHDGQCRVHVC